MEIDQFGKPIKIRSKKKKMEELEKMSLPATVFYKRKTLFYYFRAFHLLCILKMWTSKFTKQDKVILETIDNRHGIFQASVIALYCVLHPKFTHDERMYLSKLDISEPNKKLLPINELKEYLETMARVITRENFISIVDDFYHLEKEGMN